VTLYEICIIYRLTQILFNLTILTQLSINKSEIVITLTDSRYSFDSERQLSQTIKLCQSK